MIINALTTFANLLIKGLGAVGSALILLLPTSPFQSFLNIEIPYLEYLNWVIPISTFISITTSWLVAVGLYYMVQLVLRWVKVIE